MQRTAALLTLVAVLAAAHDVARAGDAPRAIDAVENDLVADDAAVRAKAAAELTDRFPDGAVAVPMLVDLLDDESPEVVAAAAKAIDSMAVAASLPVAKYCADDAHLDPKTRFGETLAVLQSLKEPPTALDAVDLDEARDGKFPPESPMLAALLPEHLGGRSALPLLVTLAQRSSGEARSNALAALALVGADSLVARGTPPAANAGRAAAADAALALLKSDRDMRSWTGARLLARLRPADPDVVAVLVFHLSTTKKPTELHGDSILAARNEIRRTLGAFGPAAAAAAPRLLETAAKADGDSSDVTTSAESLLAMGKEAEVAALMKGKPPTAYEIGVVLAKAKKAPEVVVPWLIAELDGGSPSAPALLAGYGPAAAAALPSIKKQMQTADSPRMRMWCAAATLAVAPGDAAATRFVEVACADAAPETGAEAIAVLARRAPPSAALAARLQAALAKSLRDGKSYDPSLVDGLGRCGASAKAAVPDLLKLLPIEEKLGADPASRTGAADRRRRIVQTLAAIGPDAAGATSALEALKAKGDETIRVVAAQALRRIGAKK